MIFDPLDRPIPITGDQAINRNSLQESLSNMRPIQSSELLSSTYAAEHLQKLDEMIDHEYELCDQRIGELITESEISGEPISVDLEYEPQISSLKIILLYFAEKSLLPDIESRYQRFETYLLNAYRMIDLANSYTSLNEEGKEVL